MRTVGSYKYHVSGTEVFFSGKTLIDGKVTPVETSIELRNLVNGSSERPKNINNTIHSVATDDFGNLFYFTCEDSVYTKGNEYRIVLNDQLKKELVELARSNFRNLNELALNRGAKSELGTFMWTSDYYRVTTAKSSTSIFKVNQDPKAEVKICTLDPIVKKYGFFQENLTFGQLTVKKLYLHSAGFENDKITYGDFVLQRSRVFSNEHEFVRETGEIGLAEVEGRKTVTSSTKVFFKGKLVDELDIEVFNQTETISVVFTDLDAFIANEFKLV